MVFVAESKACCEYHVLSKRHKQLPINIITLTPWFYKQWNVLWNGCYPVIMAPLGTGTDGSCPSTFYVVISSKNKREC